MIKYRFTLTNIHCAACVKLATNNLKEIPGIENISIEGTGQGSLISERELDIDEINSKYIKGDYYIKELNEE